MTLLAAAAIAVAGSWRHLESIRVDDRSALDDGTTWTLDVMYDICMCDICMIQLL